MKIPSKTKSVLERMSQAIKSGKRFQFIITYREDRIIRALRDDHVVIGDNGATEKDTGRFLSIHGVWDEFGTICVDKDLQKRLNHIVYEYVF